MSLPISLTDILLLVGVAALVLMIARSRPTPLQNGGTVQALLAQVQQLTQERDACRAECAKKDLLIERIERRAQELETDATVYRRTIKRLNEDHDQRRQELR